MKKLLIGLALLIPAAVLFSDDSLSNRPDVYGPAATQWNYSTFSATATIKASAGVLHCVTVTSAPANVWSIRDATSTAGAVVISTFPATATVGTYCYDVTTASGIQVNLPASSLCSITVSYR